MAHGWFLGVCGCESVLITVLVIPSSKCSSQEDLDISVPRYFLSERSEESKALKTMLVDIVTKVRERESDDVSGNLLTCPVENIEISSHMGRNSLKYVFFLHVIIATI